MGLVTSTIIGITDRGLVRERNEDCFVLGYPRNGQRLSDKCRVTLPLENNSLLFAVSDGMGGAQAGEIASRLTVDTIMQELPRLPSILSPQSRLEAAIEAANLAVWRRQQQNPILRGMGATVTALLIERDSAYISAVGDSRAYIVREGLMKQITTDQTMVQVLIDSGSITQEAAEKSSHRNILLQAIGHEEHLQVACSSTRIKNGDLFLICSDGLSNKVKAPELHQLLVSGQPLEEIANQLIALAKERGGEDNITVVLAQFEGDCLSGRSESLTRSIQVLSRFNPELETPAKPMRQIREATYDDWVAMAVVGFYAETVEQRTKLVELGRYGDYIVFRKGDGLVFQGERPPHTQYHYWLVSGRYRVEIEHPDGHRETLAMIVPPTDMRSNQEIQQGLDVRVKRQFFTASLAMLNEAQRNATIWCEDEENIAIRVPMKIFQQVAEILGDRFLNAVKHS